jgi:serine/threonine protein kinase
LQLFKLVPNAHELHEGIVRIDVALALAAVSCLLRALCALHRVGMAHGEINDSTIFVGMSRQRHVVGEAWRLGEQISVWLGPPVPASAARTQQQLSVESLAQIRADLPQYYAPECFNECCMLRPQASPAEDVWAVGILLVSLLHHSLPLPNRMPLVCAARPRPFAIPAVCR